MFNPGTEGHTLMTQCALAVGAAQTAFQRLESRRNTDHLFARDGVLLSGEVRVGAPLDGAQTVLSDMRKAEKKLTAKAVAMLGSAVAPGATSAELLQCLKSLDEVRRTLTDAEDVGRRLESIIAYFATPAHERIEWAPIYERRP